MIRQKLTQREFNFMADSEYQVPDETKPDTAPRATRKSRSKKAKKPEKKVANQNKRNSSEKSDGKRTRKPRPYPIVPFGQATIIGEAIHKHASGDKVRRLTLLEQIQMNPTSSTTKQTITNSGKYGITTGSYSAEWLELTPLGKIACDPDALPRAKLEARLTLAIVGVPPFVRLYEEYKGKRLAARNIMQDTLKEGKFEIDDYGECIDIFITNVKELGLLRTIAGSETLVTIEQVLDEIGKGPAAPASIKHTESGDVAPTLVAGTKNWDKVCFYVSPIGDDGTDTRKHSDLFKSSIIEPAMADLGLEVVRADDIATPGMITSSILEHLKKSRLVIADLSMLNPNVFYEIAIRHACRLPIVQIRRKDEKLPFDVGQVNTITIDNSSLYTFVPQIETFKAEVASLARAALSNPASISNPISVFYPQFWD